MAVGRMTFAAFHNRTAADAKMAAPIALPNGAFPMTTPTALTNTMAHMHKEMARAYADTTKRRRGDLTRLRNS